MSVEEDTELKDLLVQALEKNGTLAKIRAQLRASVFLALEEQERAQKKAPLLNERARQFASSQHGRQCAEIVADFLESLNLDSTLSVFLAEFELNQRRSRSTIASDLGLSTASGGGGDNSMPLLSALLKQDRRGKDDNSLSPGKSHQPSTTLDKRKQQTSTENFVNGATYFNNVVGSGSSNHKSLGNDEKDDDDGGDDDDDFFFDTAGKKKQTSNLTGVLPPTVSVREKSSIGTTNKDSQDKESKKDTPPATTNSPKSGVGGGSSTLSGSSRSHLADLPDLSASAATSKAASALPSLTNNEKKRTSATGLEFMKLLGDDSLDDTDKESTPGSSARKVPMLDLKGLQESKSNNNPTISNLSPKKNAAANTAEKSRKESSGAEDEISEEIAEDLEVDDLDSGRSSRKFSF